MHGVRIVENIFSMLFCCMIIVLQRNARPGVEAKETDADSEAGSEDCGRSGSLGVDGAESTVS